MHIEPGIVSGAKIALSYVTSAASLGVAAKLAFDELKQTKGTKKSNPIKKRPAH